MFPRIKRTKSGDREYQYLLISESYRDAKGRSTTRDVAKLGNLDVFSKQAVSSLVDGLIRLFDLEEVGRTEQIEILSSLEHGSIIFWKALWERLGIGAMIQAQMPTCDSRITLKVAKYVEMMVINRCVAPRSKLATSRWVDTTCYAAMQGYRDLPRKVEYFYRSMDYLLKAKEPIEAAIYKQLQNLFSINVRLTFHDITSSFFHHDGCSLGARGHSRDHRSDLEQVVIGVVTSFEGYPIKHYVFEGNTKDESTVAEVVARLKQEYRIEETTFVGDRGMISKLNLRKISDEGFDYIMGVKHRQDEMMPMLLEQESLFEDGVTLWRNLKIAERQLRLTDFVAWKSARLLALSPSAQTGAPWQGLTAYISALGDGQAVSTARVRELCQALGCACGKTHGKIVRLLRKHQPAINESLRLICALNEERAASQAARREEKLASLSAELQKVLASPKEQHVELRLERVFEGHNRRYRRYFRWQRSGSETAPAGFELDPEALAAERRHDGVFMLRTTRQDLSAPEVVATYKDLQEVETLFDDLKHFVDINPFRHWLADRVRSHIFLCILALLLKRVLEIDSLQSKCVTQTLETVAESKLVHYRVHVSPRSEQTREFWQVTKPTAEQSSCFAAVGISNPQSLEPYAW